MQDFFQMGRDPSSGDQGYKSRPRCSAQMKYWEIIADHVGKAGWS